MISTELKITMLQGFGASERVVMLLMRLCVLSLSTFQLAVKLLEEDGSPAFRPTTYSNQGAVNNVCFIGIFFNMPRAIKTHTVKVSIVHAAMHISTGLLVTTGTDWALLI